ncbi:glutamine ABC transporter periplasmic protein [Advenella kashmirensis WT001]|uniref:Glutamine ABC transporter periplasmic protein n=1 Tax=Advenella kashmirensis (strain DSM 17095 / LMG 22695 / WT001) TaxID=1036672 RepID=I3UGL5_ADVKW|nr:transporter substrate-binding domain-containing protein [Advenella kashmirensis]AFK64153.1 glutamine ABC transporter periplasmic protein [Advenella kashmirensis WT001]
MNLRYCSRRKSIGLALAAFTFVMLYSVMPPGARAARAETLVVATDTAFLPFEFRENGKYVGFDMDLLDLITREMGVSYSLLPMDFSNIFANLTAGKVDMAIAGITITQERERSVDFSDPYFRSDISLVVAQGNTDINRFTDLVDKRVGVKRGTEAADYVNRMLPQAKVLYFQNMDAGFPYLEVAAGRLDALVHDTANVRYYSQNKGQGLVRVVDSVATPNNFYAIAMPKDSALTQRVNAALRKAIESGSYATIYRKWFGVAPDPAKLMVR